MAPAREKSTRSAREPLRPYYQHRTINLLAPRTKHQHVYRKLTQGRIAKWSASTTMVAKETSSALVLMAPARAKCVKGARKPTRPCHRQRTIDLLAPRTKYQHVYRKFGQDRVQKSSACAMMAKGNYSAMSSRLSWLRSSRVPSYSSYCATFSSIIRTGRPVTRAPRRKLYFIRRRARAAMRFTIANDQTTTRVVQVQKCALLELPAEILNRILELCVTRSEPIEAGLCLTPSAKQQACLTYSWATTTFDGFRPPTISSFGTPSISSTCKSLRDLSLPMYGTFNTFKFNCKSCRQCKSPVQRWALPRCTFGLTVLRRHLGELTHLIRSVKMMVFTSCSDIRRGNLNLPGAVKIEVSVRISEAGELVLGKKLFHRGLSRFEPRHCALDETTLISFPDVEDQLASVSRLKSSSCTCGVPAPGVKGYDGNTLLAVLRRFRALDKSDAYIVFWQHPFKFDFLKQFKFKECTCSFVRPT